MIKLLFLIIYILMLTLYCRSTFDKFLLTPQFGVCIGFLISTVGLLFRYQRWDADISIQSITIIIIGLTVMVGTSVIMQKMLGIKNKLKRIEMPINDVKESDLLLEKWKVVFWTFIQIVSLIFVIRFLISNGGTKSLQSSINTYRRQIYITGDAVSLPIITRIVRSICIASGYMFEYLLAHRLVYGDNKRLTVLYLINILLPMISLTIVGGSRGGIMQCLISEIVIWFILYTYKTGKSVSIKNSMVVLLLAILFLNIFAQLSDVLGRGVVKKEDDTVMVYLSSSILNFDTYLHRFPTNDNKNYTLSTLINLMYEITGNKDLEYTDPIGSVYQSRKGCYLGNVYTTFQPFYHDGKMLGVILYSALVGIIGQILLYYSTIKYKVNKVSISIILYSYMYFSFFHLFYSNKVFPQLLTDTFFKMAIFLVLIKTFFFKMKFVTNSSIKRSVLKERA